MLSLSLWRGSRSGSSDHTTSTNTKSNQPTIEESSTQYGRSNFTACESTSLACSALPDTKRLVVQTAVTQLFEKNYFDICKVDQVLKMVGGRQAGPAYDMLHSLHCVHYDKMPQELRDRLPHLVNEVLRQKQNTDVAAFIALQDVDY